MESSQSRLRLFLAWADGSPKEGPDAEDTVFLVRARSVESAAELADLELLNFAYPDTSFYVKSVREVGADSALTDESDLDEVVLLGPVLQRPVIQGEYQRWIRLTNTDSWHYYGRCQRCGYNLREQSKEEPHCRGCGWDRRPSA